MVTIQNIRKSENGAIVIGNHAPIIQSVLDFDFLSGKLRPSIRACITANRKALKFFWGREEVLIPCFPDIPSIPKSVGKDVEWMLNASSGRRAREHTVAFFDAFPRAYGGHIFAENVPERDATDLIARFGGKKLIAGPSGVGLLVPSCLKLGAIGGTDASQIEKSRLTEGGAVAVVSTSGGMTNEIIRTIVNAGRVVSFAVAIGGDRFPVTSLSEVFMLAQHDPHTKAVVYFGELGGTDEYEIACLIKEKKITKPVYAYIAGTIDECFDEHMQFGHAKALVAHQNESARAKRGVLRRAGASVPKTFSAFVASFKKLPAHTRTRNNEKRVQGGISPDALSGRRKSILSTREVVDAPKTPTVIKKKKVQARGEGAFTKSILETLLGHAVSSRTTVAFADAVFELLIDHGGNVSGAVNTMISARAGKDLVSSLASGLLTIGPRFGGAMNEAARTWHRGVLSKEDAQTLVRKETAEGRPIAGIGHRKYRVGAPDPRVDALCAFTATLKKHPHYDFACAVEKVTTGKNGSLILNIDGAVAALALDIFSECERMSQEEIEALIDTEFFNALFVIPRSVGFIAHYMEQKKNDEGIFRLPDELLFTKKTKR